VRRRGNPPQGPNEGGHPRRHAILAVVMLGTILGPIDASIVNVILPTITRSFSASMAAAQWVPMAYLLTIGSLVLMFGRLGDIWGYRRIFLMGMAGFVAASGLCALAPGMGWLVGFRVLQGLAAGMTMAVPLAILTRAFPASQRGRVLGTYAVSISVGLAIGPSLGGFLAAAFGWRSAFLINLPIGLTALALASRVLPEMAGRPGRLDLAGAAAALGALSSFLLFVNRAQQVGFTLATAAILAAAAALGTLFLRIESRTPEPMLRLELFRVRALSFGSLAALLNFMSQYVVVFLTPFLLQRLLAAGPGRVGLIMTAFPLSVLCVAPFAGALSDRIGTAGLAFVGTSVCAAGCALLAGVPAGAGAHEVAWRLVVFGVGTGIFQSPNNSAVMGSAPREHLGVVSSLLGTTRTVGMTLGVAAAGAVLYAFVPAAVLRSAVLAPANAAAFVTGVRHAYAAGAVFAALAALCCLVRVGRRVAVARP
jgi:EmrB/QacA subfamily drug resistance transporter